MKTPDPTCLLCGAALEAYGEGLHLHPDSALCAVVVTDRFGRCVDDRFEFVDGEIYERDGAPLIVPSTLIQPIDVLPKQKAATKEFSIDIAEDRFMRVEPAVELCFREVGLEKLGGASGDYGWSSYSLYQRCPYAWFRQHVLARQLASKDAIALYGDEPKALSLGILVHVFLACHYEAMRDDNFPLPPDLMAQQLRGRINPEFFDEAWRLFEGYRNFYTEVSADPFIPLAVEHHVVDPETKDSCRYDLVAKLDEPWQFWPEGTYIIEHKTAPRRDQTSLNSWFNDGEILGQMRLWRKLKLDRRFGPLRGVIVNLIFKTKELGFERIFVSPDRWQLKSHESDLKMWRAIRSLAIASGHFPRSRANCVNRFGFCQFWTHCATNDNPSDETTPEGGDEAKVG